MIIQNNGIAPVKSAARIKSLDVIRGIALLGILLMNINGMGLPFAYDDPTLSGGSDGLNLQVWIMNNMLFEGTMRGLFTMLFGAGMILLTTRLLKAGAGISTADIYYRRMIWLLVFGIFHAYILLWEGEILYPYAIFGLMLFPFRNTAPKNLVLIAVGLITIGSLWDYADYKETRDIYDKGIAAELILTEKDTLNKEQQSAFDAWEKKKKKKSPDEVKEAIEEMHQGYWTVLKNKVGVIQFFQTRIVYRYWTWDLLSYMLLGMALFKWKVFQGGRTRKFYLLMMLVGYAIGLAVNYYETSMLLENNFDVLAKNKAGITYQLGRLFTTLGHIGLFMLFIKSGFIGFLQSALAAVGKMALTNYVMHSVIVMFIFYGFGFSLFGQLQRFELYYIVLGIWVIQLIYSPLWFRYYRYGPLEWLWRSLTYGKKQPLKKNP